jgi:predicted transport protein
MEYVQSERIWLKNNAEHDEAWVQTLIAANPSLLGLGELILKDKERIHIGSGRLDLLLQDEESKQRYEVEVQLGKTDESHIIRTIEYWDVERKRYPQYDHTAVIVAEDITSRFLNVISLFNGFIPLIAIQMHAVRIKDYISLSFVKVLDERKLGLIEEDEETAEITDRAYWEKNTSRLSLEIVDRMLSLLKEIDSSISLGYGKRHIAILIGKRVKNFVVINPRKNWIKLSVYSPFEIYEEFKERLEQSDLKAEGYNSKYASFEINLQQVEDIENNKELLKSILLRSYENSI